MSFEKVERSSGFHPLLNDASILRSDYKWIQTIAQIWARVMNFEIFGTRPLLCVFTLFSKSHDSYLTELAAIATVSDAKKKAIKDATKVYGGETEQEYAALCKEFDAKMVNFPRVVGEFRWYDKSDSLEAAKKWNKTDGLPQEVIAIVNFANAVRVGGADSVGGKGSQEEQLFRATCLRVSLEHAYEKSNPAIRAKTGRYIPYYGAVVSQQVPCIQNEESQECFGFISAAAPDLRTGLRSEGNYFRKENDPQLVREVLRRKLAVVMMSAALAQYHILVLGAFGAGAFKNDPKMVAEVIQELATSQRFAGLFSRIVLPIGPNDPNRKPFEEVFGKK